MKIKAFLFALSFLVALTLGTTARAQAFTDHFDDKFPASGIGFSDCTGEPIFFEGFLHVHEQITANANGYHIEFHNQLYGQGTGLISGKQYIYQDVYNDNFNFNSLPIEETTTENFRIIGQGKLEDLMAKVTFHITINANGQVTADQFVFRIGCK